MKKKFVLAAAFAFSIIPFTSFADHLDMGVGAQFIELMISGDLSHRDLEGMPLDTYYRQGYFIGSGANLSNTNLKDADLEGLNLIDADLSNANLQYTNLADTNLTGADLSGATLVGTILTNANLSNATFNTLITSNNDLSNVDLTGADLSDAMLFGLDGFADIKSCPDKMPSGWFCENNTFMFGESSNETQEETVEETQEETAETEDIDFDSITVESLPYSVGCMPKGKMLKIKQNKKEKFVVRFHKGKKFYKGFDFDEAVDVFEETYEDKCVE